MRTEEPNIETSTPGVECDTDTVAVTLDVPVEILATLAGDELDTETSMRAAVAFWADMSPGNRAELVRERSPQIRDGGAE